MTLGVEDSVATRLPRCLSLMGSGFGVEEAAVGLFEALPPLRKAEPAALP